MGTKEFKLLKASALETKTDQIKSELEQFNQEQIIQAASQAAESAFADVIDYAYIFLQEDFSTGFTLTSDNQAVSYEGSWYRWDGELPKTVIAGGTPSNTGGVGVGGWVNVTNSSRKSIENIGFKAMTAYDSGIASKWLEPIAISRFENGVPYTYWGSTSGDGLQKVNRVNLSSGKVETKTVNNLYLNLANDHFAPAINFLPSGKIFIGCTSHNINNKVHYGVFDDWDSVTLLPNEFVHTDDITGYIQIVNCNFRTFVFSRTFNSATNEWQWRYFYSDDDFATVSISRRMLQPQLDQLYMIFRSVDRFLSTGDDTDSVVRFMACGNAHNMTDRRLMRGTLSYNEVSEVFEFNTSTTNVTMDTGGTTFDNLIEIYKAPVGKRFRLTDLADGDASMALIIEFDEDSPYGNAKNYLLLVQAEGTPAVKVEIPIPVGVSLPFKTYFTEMCFLRPESPAQQNEDGVEIFVATDDGGYNGDYLLYRCLYSITTSKWDVSLISRINSSVGRYYRPLPVKGGLADCMCPVIREYDTNPPSPAYRNFNGRTEVFWGYSRTNKYHPSQSRAKISLSNGVEMLKRKRLTVSQVLELSDANHELQLDFATDGTLTIQPFAKTWFQKGDKFSLASTGAGVVTIQAAAGVALNGVVGGSCTLDPYKGAVLTCEGKNNFSIIGGNTDVS